MTYDPPTPLAACGLSLNKLRVGSLKPSTFAVAYTPFTDRYTALPDPLHRTRFLIVTQLPLLDQYRARMAASLDAFETLSSAFVRAVPGALGVGASGAGAGADQGVVWGGDTRRLTGGVEGLQRLCKAFVSAKSLTSAMENWGEELVRLSFLSKSSINSMFATVFP